VSKFYLDTDSRMASDPEFRHCVMTLIQFADRFGFTPGELKQIAFRAALELEMRRPGQWVLTQRDLDEIDETIRAEKPTSEQVQALHEYLRGKPA
jgi:hypothetical protein